jgi:hypothetical protein
MCAASLPTPPTSDEFIACRPRTPEADPNRQVVALVAPCSSYGAGPCVESGRQRDLLASWALVEDDWPLVRNKSGRPD